MNWKRCWGNTELNWDPTYRSDCWQTLVQHHEKFTFWRTSRLQGNSVCMEVFWL